MGNTWLVYDIEIFNDQHASIDEFVRNYFEEPRDMGKSHPYLMAGM